VKGEHIRVSLILERLTSRKLRVLEALCHLLGTVIAWLLAGFSIHLAWTSYELNDISQGMDEMPLWIPQIAMALGSVVLAVALTDRLCGVLFDRHWQPQRSDLTFSE
jgi:TRAP-type C4-dicarboxylate transport system permease small subunit